MRCWGVQAVSVGGAENKIKKGEARVWAWVAIGFGPVQPMNLGSVREEYKRVVDPFFLIFTKSFSLFSSLLKLSVLSLLSLLSLIFSDEKDGGRKWSEAEAAAAAAGRHIRRRRRCKCFFYFFFILLIFLQEFAAACEIMVRFLVPLFWLFCRFIYRETNDIRVCWRGAE